LTTISPDLAGSSRLPAPAQAAGAAVVLGAGTYAATAHRGDKNTEVARPSTPGVATSAAGTARADAVPSSSGATGAAPAVSPVSVAPRTGQTRSVEQQIADARAAAAKGGNPVTRALTPAPGAVPGPVQVRNSGSYKTGGTLRVVTARHDLSGQRELLWAADRGQPVGDARCTQNFHFSNNGAPRVRPTMLMCWRVSAKKSVVIVAVKRGGHPSKDHSVAVLDREWARLH
jgi:hypothetical protein